MTQEGKMFIGFGILTVVILVGGVFLLSKSQQNVDMTASQNGNTKELLIRNTSHKTTEGIQKVQLVEFADFQCPACEAAFPVIEEIRKIYGDKLTYVYRNFPLPQHPQGKLAAQAAEAAGEQGKFWEMYEILYAQQSEWSGKNNAAELFTSYAQKLQLDTAKFNKDVSSEKMMNRIAQDTSDAASLGVNQTPTFFLNGEMMAGIPDKGVIMNKIDALLKE